MASIKENEVEFMLNTIRNIALLHFPEEYIFLYLLAKVGPGKGPIVEIGSMKGGSTICLALGARARNDKVYSIDFQPNEAMWADFLRNIKAAKVKNIIPIRDYSYNVIKKWKLPIRLLFIDGGHDYEDVKRDFEWTKFLIKRGIVVLHDASSSSKYEGVRQVAEEFLIGSKKFTNIGFFYRMAYGQKL